MRNLFPSLVLMLGLTSNLSAQPLEWKTEFLGRTKIDRGTLDLSRVSKVRNFLIFPAAYEAMKDYGKTKWYDLVAYNCASGEYKVIFATESETPPKSMEELLLDKNEAQADAQAYGHLHEWSSMLGLSDTLKRYCPKAPRSAHKYLPFQFGETAKTAWWIDLANLEFVGQTRNVFAFSRQFQIVQVKRAGMEFGRLEFTKGNEVTFRWALNCAKRSSTTLLMSRNDETGAVVETINKPGPEESVIPNTIGHLALALPSQGIDGFRRFSPRKTSLQWPRIHA